MVNHPPLLKEVLVECSQTDKWNEISFNTGGAPSILQDIKVQPHSGGYSFTTIPNRFIYWRANHDVLELVEHSLNTNLVGNQVRYSFQNSPILEGISVQEYGSSIVLLVPTVCSVHRLTFRYPAEDSANDKLTPSIFSDVSADNLLNPTTYHLFSAAPYIPHTAASTLLDDNDAVFALALNNNTILLIHLKNLTGMATVNYLKQESSVPRRFLSGITDVLRGKSNEDNSVISMTMEMCEDTAFLFTFNKIGQLRVWCCSKMQCVYEYDFVSSHCAFGAQSHVIRKYVCSDMLKLAVFLSLVEGSQINVVSINFGINKISMQQSPLVRFAPENCDLTEMAFNEDGDAVWCIWRSLETGRATVSSLTLVPGTWTTCLRATSPVIEYAPVASILSAGEYYLNAIFAPAAFSSADIAKVLSIYKGVPQIETFESKMELRSKVCMAVKSEIAAEALEYELSDDDYIDISERCWNRFYLNCVQYQETGQIPNGLIWLSSCSMLVLIMKNNLSFFRSIESLEANVILPEKSRESQSYQHLLEVLNTVVLSDDQKMRFNQELHRYDLEDTLLEITNELKEKQILQSETDKLLRYQDLSKTLRNLCDDLFIPETFEQSMDYCESFRGDLGHKVLCSTIHEIVRIRYDVCRNLLIILYVLNNNVVKGMYKAECTKLCQAYSVLNWCCETVAQKHPLLISIMQLILNKPNMITQYSLIESVWSVLQHVWPLTNSFHVAEFLLIMKENVLLSNYAKLVPSESWNWILVQNLLDTNEPYKAYDMATRDVQSSEYYLKTVELFHRADQPDIIIDIVNIAIAELPKNDVHLFFRYNSIISYGEIPQSKPTHNSRTNENATLYSILFSNYLKLGHYLQAFVILKNNPNQARRVDGLRDLLVTLITSKEYETLLSLPYENLATHFDNIMIQRARSMPSPQANIYYNLLYAFYIKAKNYRKAGRVVFEQGYRSDSNEQQMISYTMCVNCLSLDKSGHSYVLKPKLMECDDDEESLEIYELVDVHREYELALARSKLDNCPADTSATEVMARLISSKLFRTALRIAFFCSLDYEPSFTALATACATLHNDPDPWSWLTANEISDYVVGDNNPVTVTWRFLEALLIQFEEPNLTSLHKIVANRLLSLNAEMPFWLQLSYKKRNPAELLRIYLKYGELNKASKLCCEWIDAALGRGKEMFNIKESLTIRSSPMCFPVNTVDLLLHELHFQKMNDLYDEVKNAVDVYLETAERICHDKLRFDRSLTNII